MDAGGGLVIAKFTSRRDTLPVQRAEVATLSLARFAWQRDHRAAEHVSERRHRGRQQALLALCTGSHLATPSSDASHGAAG